MRRLGEVDRVHEMPLNLQPPDGPAFAAALTVAVVNDRRGRPSGLRWLLRDVSSRAASPAAQVAGNGDATPHALFEQAPRGMGRLSPEGRWLAVNHTLREFLGYRREELLRLNVQDVTHPDDRAAVAKRLHALQTGEVPASPETFAGSTRTAAPSPSTGGRAADRPVGGAGRMRRDGRSGRRRTPRGNGPANPDRRPDRRRPPEGRIPGHAGP